MNTQQQIGRLLIDVASLCKTSVTTALLETRSDGIHSLTDDDIKQLSQRLNVVIDQKFSVALDQVVNILTTKD